VVFHTQELAGIDLVAAGGTSMHPPWRIELLGELRAIHSQPEGDPSTALANRCNTLRWLCQEDDWLQLCDHQDAYAGVAAEVDDQGVIMPQHGFNPMCRAVADA
jgi:hypothetical protein